ncbi:AAA family ATPase [Ureibacillus manganicus]|uniref:AAA family ATPase n=1 Tax=Ureibacillus manganicus TaxID=1266064 RepID=UPI0009DE79AF|nr:AAA family ATPase [Ureibacillus manganicus]
MIIWINGAFGAGKTETANELHRRIPKSFIYDPEILGQTTRWVIPKEIGKADFQDFEVWREGNYCFLKYLAREYDGVLIVPMTIVNPQYYDEIIGRLRNDGVTVNHFVLSATKETIDNRLLGRGEEINSWASQQIDRCLKGLRNERFQPRIETEQLSISEVAEMIAEMVGVELLPATHK